jgi:hypothetical protein
MPQLMYALSILESVKLISPVPAPFVTPVPSSPASFDDTSVWTYVNESSNVANRFKDFIHGTSIILVDGCQAKTESGNEQKR